MIVADTNLIASLLMETAATQAAESVFKKDPLWTAPALWRYEFRNVLTMQVRHADLRLDAAVELCAEAEKIIAEPEIEVGLESVLRLAAAHKLTAYDAEFLALAHALNIQLVTMDGGILKAAPETAVRPEDF
jgi:predicted nucleic acid-binding protein